MSRALEYANLPRGVSPGLISTKSKPSLCLLKSSMWCAISGTPTVSHTRVLLGTGIIPSPPKGCIFHSDRGSQYCSHDYQKILREHKFQVSMSGKGNCYDNAAIETFFKTIKAELIWRRTLETRRQAETAIFQYIKGKHEFHCTFLVL